MEAKVIVNGLLMARIVLFKNITRSNYLTLMHHLLTNNEQNNCSPLIHVIAGSLNNTNRHNFGFNNVLVDVEIKNTTCLFFIVHFGHTSAWGTIFTVNYV